MSAADLFLAKNFGQYVLVLESDLANNKLSKYQQAALHSNIARAQLGNIFGNNSPHIHLALTYILKIL